MGEVAVEETPIPGLLVFRLPLHRDARGWFKENWHREKMTEAGLPDFGPVQHNVSYNLQPGVTRGIHAEPWDKFVSLTQGRGFGAWVDLREGPYFGTTFHVEMDPTTAVFVPRGVGNSYQALEAGTAYSYLVNDHWHPGSEYLALALDDPHAAIPWPIELDRAEVSEKDRHNPTLDAVKPVPRRRALILGAGGQVGLALQAEFPDAVRLGLSELDITDEAHVAAWPWADHDLVLNAAAYTVVDAAESPDGRRQAWATNAAAPARLAELAAEFGFVLVHYSTDYVFDGTREAYDEAAPLCPLGVYAQSKAAGDLAVRKAPRHYLLRTSWMVGDGGNFVRTMARLAAAGSEATVVDDQIGRLTFADELARATRHLVDSDAAYGTYNCTNSGPATSWADIAQRVFELCGREPGAVTPVSTERYGAGKQLAPRPRRSLLDLSKLVASGFEPRDAGEALREYLAGIDDGAEP
jgi:dTDP-4-dehydrorhamnose 3,5-epimerase/reductase